MRPRRGVALLLCTALCVAACSGDPDPTAGGPDTSADRSSITRVVPGSDATIPLGLGAELIVEAGDLASPGEVRVAPPSVAPPAFEADWFTPAGPAVAVEVDAELDAPLSIRFLADGPTPDAVPVILRHDAVLGWYPVGTGTVADAAVSERTFFSPFSFGWITDIADAISDGVREVLGDRADALTCDGPPTWTDFTPPAQDVVHSCATTNLEDSTEVERAEVQIRNNRGITIEVVVPDSAVYAFVEGQPELVRAGVRALTGRDSVLLPPGGFMSVGFVRPGKSAVVTVPVTLSPTGLVYTLLEGLAAGDTTSLYGMLSLLSECTGNGVTPLDVQPDVADLVAAARNLLDCGVQLLQDPQATATIAAEYIASTNGISTSAAIADSSFAPSIDKIAGTLRFLGGAMAVVTIGSDVIDVVADLYVQTATSGLNSMSPQIGLRAAAAQGIVSTDPQLVLRQFVPAWLAGDRAAMRRYATDAAIDSFDSVVQGGSGEWEFSVSDRNCHLGSSGAGGCEVLVWDPNGPCCALIYQFSYHENGDRLAIDNVEFHGDAG